jgi:galactose mutarotase-like enzyme
MKAPTNQLVTRQLQGFNVYVLGNEEAELSVVPELGAKIISLKNRRTHREWLWHPKDDLRLFKNQPCDDFSASPLAGMDECLPTILPCVWRGRDLPDHGEVWNQPWQVDDDAGQNGILTTSIQLKTSPLVFKRTIELRGNEIRFDYQLSNISAAEEHFVWALHPLLRLAAGDELDLPDSTRALFNGETWVDAITSAAPKKNCAKVFAYPVQEGRAAIKNEAQGDRLEFVWDPVENNALGLWLTRGGWHGHHHFAIEPTNANHDSLVVAADHNRSGAVAGNSSVTWQILLRVGCKSDWVAALSDGELTKNVNSKNKNVK